MFCYNFIYSLVIGLVVYCTLSEAIDDPIFSNKVSASHTGNSSIEHVFDTDLTGYRLMAGYNHRINNTPTETTEEIDPTMVAYWPFEKFGFDFVTFDETENNHDLIALNGNENIKIKYGPFGRYFTQIGSGAEIIVRNSRGNFIFPKFTIETVISPLLNGEQQVIFASTEMFETYAYSGYYLEISPDGNIELNLGSGISWKSISSNTALINDLVYHVVATYDSSKVRIYINGVLDIEETYSGPISYGNGNATIGGWIKNGDLRLILKSPIDEMKIYNRAITELEVAEKYQDYGL